MVKGREWNFLLKNPPDLKVVQTYKIRLSAHKHQNPHLITPLYCAVKKYLPLLNQELTVINPVFRKADSFSVVKFRSD